MRSQVGHNLVARLAAHQHAAHWAAVADARAGRAAIHLGMRRIRKVGPAPSRVWTASSPAARVPASRLWQGSTTRQARDAITQGSTGAARLQEFALHVDHHQRAAGGVDGDRTGGEPQSQPSPGAPKRRIGLCDLRAAGRAPAEPFRPRIRSGIWAGLGRTACACGRSRPGGFSGAVTRPTGAARSALPARSRRYRPGWRPRARWCR